MRFLRFCVYILLKFGSTLSYTCAGHSPSSSAEDEGTQMRLEWPVRCRCGQVQLCAKT